jgi:Ca-activated chloride channel family protein
VPLIATLLVGSLLVAVTKAAWPAEACGPDAVAAQASPQLGSAAITVTVLSSSNKDAIMEEMACRFEAAGNALGDTPIDVVVMSEASGAAFQSIGDRDLMPTVWSPAATSWVNMLRQAHENWVPPPSEISSIAKSPQVIAMPRTIAEGPGLNWPDGSLGWSDIVDYATHPDVWASIAPGWGSFKLGKTNPRLSTSGLNSTVATFAEITDHSPSELTTEQIDDPHVLAEVHRVEEATVHYAPTSVDFLSNLRAQDDAGTGENYVSAILLEEKSVWDYNQGNPSGDPTTLGVNPPPATPLVAFYPEEGALVADHPFVVLKSKWVSPDQRLAAGKFLEFLLEKPQQERFQELGFRNADGEPGPEITEQNGLLPQEKTSTLTAPDGSVLRAIRDGWSKYRKQARVLLVMDVSSSMLNSPATGLDESKLELEKAAALQAIGQLGPHDVVGLWTYGSTANSTPGEPYSEVVPLGRVSQNRGILRVAIRGLTADAGNGGELYDATAAAVNELRTQVALNTDKINGIVLVSDGPDAGSVETREQLLSEVVPLHDQQEVRIFTIAFGDNADATALSDLAHASLGTPYDATDPAQIGKVFYQVVANF